MNDLIHQQALVPTESGGSRLDQVAAELFPDFSRSRLQAWIKAGELTVNGEVRKGKDKVHGGEQLELHTELEEQGDWEAEDIPLDIRYEDDSILVLNKPAGLVVHPAAGNYTGTLLNALLFHCPDLVNIPRAGIVHRLDKDTTGLMVVAKTLQAQRFLVAQMQKRSVTREYEAVVQGHMTGGGKVDAPIGRHPRSRQKMAVVGGGKDAVTHYRVLKRFRHYTHVRLKLETGRTHQIRVHMAHIGYPLIGDGTYSGRFKIPRGCTPDMIELLRSFPRQALHAATLGLIHPVTRDYMEWQSDRPDDFTQLLVRLHEEDGLGA
jgi:23S rRNA pseudouridine1911/1915/1917 synthase